MKTTNFFLGTLALSALALTACSNDLNVDNPHLNEADGIRYLKVAIANTPGTRADETNPGDGDDETYLGDGDGKATFETGDPQESVVKSLYLKFYGINGEILPNFDSNNVEFNWTVTTGNQNVGKIGEAIVELSLSKGSPKPAYVIAFINPVDFSTLDDHTKMEDLRNTTREGFSTTYTDNDGKTKELFAMNNAAYYGPAGIADAQKTKIMATPISPDMLYTTKEAAQAENAEAVEIYVERYAAKVNFSINEGASQPIILDNYTFTFVPEAWTINADAPSMYVSKRFENSNSKDHITPTYTEVQKMLGKWTSWNDATNHRSYWACSPSYYSEDFPRVSDNIIDRMPDGETGAGEVVGPYALKYYSYNQITNQDPNIKVGVQVASANGSNHKYVLENTMGKPAFDCSNPKAAAPSVVVVGEYEVKKGETKINPGKGFCIYSEKIYWRDEVPVGADGETILKHMLDENLILYTINNYVGDKPVYTLLKYDAEIAKKFDVIHPKKEVRGTQDIPHRYVTLQLKDDLTVDQLSTLYYKPVGESGYKPLATTGSTTEAQRKQIIIDINKQLWAQLGNARAYNTGKGYFSIPIQHLGYTENNNGKPETDGVLDWTKVRVGDFGLVRNHVYSINVSEISGWASGIEDLDNPLVPSMDDYNYWVKYRVNILNWRVVPAQSGIVLK